MRMPAITRTGPRGGVVFAPASRCPRKRLTMSVARAHASARRKPRKTPQTISIQPNAPSGRPVAHERGVHNDSAVARSGERQAQQVGDPALPPVDESDEGTGSTEEDQRDEPREAPAVQRDLHKGQRDPYSHGCTHGDAGRRLLPEDAPLERLGLGLCSGLGGGVRAVSVRAHARIPSSPGCAPAGRRARTRSRRIPLLRRRSRGGERPRRPRVLPRRLC